KMRIRSAQISDLHQLAHLCEALWPTSSATEHAQELHLILQGNAALVLTMPIEIFVADEPDGTLVGFVEVDLRSHAEAAIRHSTWATSRAGTLPRITAIRESAKSCLKGPRTGPVVTSAPRSLPMPSSIMKFPSMPTKLWATRLWTAVCIIGSGSEKPRPY